MANGYDDQTSRRRASARQSQARRDARSSDRQRALRESAIRQRAESAERKKAAREATKRRMERSKEAEKEVLEKQRQRLKQQKSVHGRNSDLPSRDARVGMPSPTSPSRGYTANRARKMQKKVSSHTLGSHVEHAPAQQSHRSEVTEVIRRRARRRRFLAGALGILIIIGVAVVMGVFAFRGSVGSSMALKNSDATEVLKPVTGNEPYFVLIATELGAVAEPLENPGPDCLILARVDNANHSLGLINIPANLQVTYENRTFALSSIAEQGDAKLIQALSAFTKLDIAHYVKLEDTGLSDLVDKLDGIQIDLEQVIDDPQAGDVYLPAGPYTLTGPTAVYYSRATNLKMGTQDKLNHQLKLTSLIIERIFGEGVLGTNIDAISSCFQTDMSLGDLEAIAAWFKGKKAGDIVIANLPGYTTGVTNIDQQGQQRYISTYDDFLSVLKAIEAGQSPTSNDTEKVEAASPSSFTVEVQNGTGIAGLAAATADTLKEKGFNVGEVGNAEMQAYEETLVVYRDDDGLSKAKSVIEALGIGRAVGNADYYTFEGDVVVIIGSDYSPVN